VASTISLIVEGILSVMQGSFPRAANRCNAAEDC